MAHKPYYTIVVKQIFFTLSLTLGLSWVGYAQVEEIKNAKIDSIAQAMIKQQNNTGENKSPALKQEDIPAIKGEEKAMGFRVQIYFGSDRKKAYDEQARFKALFPDIETYISYKQPNYRVKVGDFITRENAKKLQDELRASFPPLFIFREEIVLQTKETKPVNETTRED